MLLILSEKGDLSTNDVIDWLYHLKVPFIRLNSDETEGVSINAENFSDGLSCKIVTKNHTFYLNEIIGYWYRRGGLPFFKIPVKSIDEAFDENVRGKVKEYLNNEAHTLYAFLHRYLDQIPGKIGSSESAGVNKLIVLDTAKKIGLKTPNWSVLMEKEDAVHFIEKHGGEVITKGIWESLIVSTDDSGYSTYTEQVGYDSFDDIKSTFFPSLLQNKIQKKYEVRVFFLLDSFWSMAIFSQNDPQTTVDFRKYNDDKPNRNIPFQLPKEIEEKLIKLMRQLKLETGSIDLIVDENDDFIFLEVNPVGQFGMTSSPCNYSLEKKIAQHFYNNQKSKI